MARRTLSAHESNVGAAKSRGSFRPLRPDLDKFLFAEVEDETDEMPGLGPTRRTPNPV